MANKKKSQKVIRKTSKKFPSNDFVMKALLLVGMVFLGLSLVRVMDYFFVKNSNIGINMSTDKKVEYLALNGKEELVTTKKYVSDLDYTMRYDTDNFRVFKYKKQDIYSFLNNYGVALSVEKADVPSNCARATLDNEYASCYVMVDHFTEEYYFSKDKVSYKITIKLSDDEKNKELLKNEVKYMLSSFNIKNKK
jgi:hypothetical protein